MRSMFVQGDVVIAPFIDSDDVNAFLSFPGKVYRDDPNWVPPVWSERAALLDRQRNPFFPRGEAEFLLARREGEVVGTIAVGFDRHQNAYRQERAAFFASFESIADDAVARDLFVAASRWAKARGATVLRGPSGLGLGQPAGLLVEGFDRPPVILTGHNREYYPRLVESFGFRKWGADHLAYRLDLTAFGGDPSRLPAQLQRVADRVATRSRAQIRSVRMRDWSTEIERARQIYNQSLVVLSDFIPLTEAEFARQGELMRSIVDPDLLLFLEVDGREVGFVVALPDVNQALRFGSGLRTPWDWAKVWWHRRKIDCVSFKILALLPSHQSAGLGSLLYRELATRVIQKGYTWMDLSLTGEDNPQTNRIATAAGARIYKRYRTYELPLHRSRVEVTQ